MRAFKPAIWHPIALALSVVNLVAVGFAAAAPEPLHATVHASLAVAFGLWARRLRQAPVSSASDRETQLDALEDEVSNLRMELSETQERLDFTERLLAQGLDARRSAPEG